ncbi:ABC transporter permease [Roseomonas nepalensis]|uniref:ABC transporter permease n=1 Tax=Muricoccus nepalensis TaxID=1854500 RepID=A0A502GH19_9PROT|nr:ABC transporter permease [Roseomonas nepalensis]TPG61164.1 ABC transporter permease [Roseomonas nepalensis]
MARDGTRLTGVPAEPRWRQPALAALRGASALALPLLILAAWQWAGGERGVLLGGALPTPLRVWEAWQAWAFGPVGMGLNAYSGTWLGAVLFSAGRVAQGFLLAVALAVPLGILIGWSRGAAALVDPTIQMLRPIPITAWLPFSIAIFGIRDFGAIFLIALGVFYPVVVNATQGAREVERNWIRAALMLGSGRMKILLHVVLPAALPAIFTGMRIGLGVGWTAVIVSEMVAVKSGLGYVLWDAYYVGRMDVVLADMATIGVLGLLTDRAILLLAGRLLRWRALAAHGGGR